MLLECKHVSVTTEQGLLPVTRLLDELQMDRSAIDEVVLVGGTTRIPRIKDQVVAIV